MCGRGTPNAERRRAPNARTVLVCESSLSPWEFQRIRFALRSGRPEEGYVVGVASHDSRSTLHQPAAADCPSPVVAVAVIGPSRHRSGRRKTRGAVIASDEIFHRPVTFPRPRGDSRCVLGLRMCARVPHHRSRASHRHRAVLRFLIGSRDFVGETVAMMRATGPKTT